MCPLGEKMAKIWLKLQENGEKKSQMAKVMVKEKYILARTLLRKLGLPTLEYRRQHADIIQVYKILNGIDKVDKNKLFSVTTYNRTLGHPKKLFKERSRLNVRANSFSNSVVNIWNQLPEDVVMAPSLNTFKSRLNKHWSRDPYKFTAPSYEPGQTTGLTWNTHQNVPEEVR